MTANISDKASVRASVKVGDEIKVRKDRDPYNGQIGTVYARWEGLRGSVWVKVIFPDLAKGLYEDTEIETRDFSAYADEYDNRYA